MQITDVKRNTDAGPAKEAQLVEILAKLESPRASVVDAWQARAVIFSREQQARLREEVGRTCEILGSLASRS